MRTVNLDRLTLREYVTYAREARVHGEPLFPPGEFLHFGREVTNPHATLTNTQWHAIVMAWQITQRFPNEPTQTLQQHLASAEARCQVPRQQGFIQFANRVTQPHITLTHRQWLFILNAWAQTQPTTPETGL